MSSNIGNELIRSWPIRLCDSGSCAVKTDIIVIENTNERVVIGFRADRVVLQRGTAAVTNTFMVEFDSLNTAGANRLQKFRIIVLFRRRAADAAKSLNDRQKYDDNYDKNEYIFG